MRFAKLVLFIAAALCLPAEDREKAESPQPDDAGWTAYGHDLAGTRHSPLHQINRTNVATLRQAWIYHTGALEPASDLNQKAAFEATPILIEGTLYLSTPFNQVIALDPATGKEKWKFDPKIDRSHGYSEVTSRGVAAWIDSKAPTSAVCRTRILQGTIDARLLALDGSTGRPCTDFGANGEIDLTAGVDLRNPGDYQVTSPPTVVGDLIIIGSSIGDNRAVNVERGTVRAFDARSGKQRWSWNPIPWSEKQELRTGAANAWSIFAADPARDLVFIPTGSASPDYYGGLRPGDNRHANSMVALKASTGHLVWSFQVVHHDLWDYDIASQPLLISFHGQPAVAVTTKLGNVFVLDRETGKPLMKVEERAVPKSDVPGEEASPTQPFPAWSPMVPQKLSADEAWGPTPEARAACKQKIESLRNDGLFTPPAIRGTLVFPGNAGGVNWGAAAWDSTRNLIIANTNRLAWMVKLIPRAELASVLDQDKQNRFLGEFARQTGTPYAMYREWLRSSTGAPCNPPPWGALVAFDVNTGKLRWEAPIGDADQNIKNIGLPNLGGPMTTDGGLIFTAATKDTILRAFDIDKGTEVWRVNLSAGAQSTPMTYEFNGKQYVVICAGGHGKLESPMGDSVVAFALP